MPQIKTKRKQNKILKRVKIVSLLASFLVLFAIAELIYKNLVIGKPLYLDPISGSSSNSKIADALYKRNIDYRNINEGSNYFVLELSRGEVVIISKNKDIAQQLSSLQLIQSRLKIEGKEFKSLDLRYAQPVVKQ